MGFFVDFLKKRGYDPASSFVGIKTKGNHHITQIKGHEMSNRKQLNKMIAEKIKTRSDRLASAGADLEEAGGVLADYRLYFQGALDALQAAGVEDVTPVKLAFEANETELSLIEQRINLENALQDEEW